MFIVFDILLNTDEVKYNVKSGLKIANYSNSCGYLLSLFINSQKKSYSFFMAFFHEPTIKTVHDVMSYLNI